MAAPYRIAFIGLADTERQTILACLRMLAPARQPCYTYTATLDEADFVIADAEHTPSVKLVLATERLRRALWVGTPPPMGSVAVVDRPLDARALLTELDALVAHGARPRTAAAASPASEGDWDGADRRRLAAKPAEPPTPVALLVDDSELALRYLETRLQRWGLVMERALSSGRAIELMAHKRYDCVFLDVELGPGSDLDGLALCQHIKRQHERAGHAPTVVLVSAHASESDRARGSLAGCDGYLAKPVDEVELQRQMLRMGFKLRAPVTAPGA